MPKKVSQLTASTSRSEPPADSLSTVDLAGARRAAERLRAELAELIRTFPVERRNISEMSRWLRVSRPVCQRVVQAVRQRGDPLQSLKELPGVQGLATFVESARQAGCDQSAVVAAHAAAVEYADLVDRCGGSQTRLLTTVERLLEDRSDERSESPVAHPDATGGSVHARRQVFEGARVITGRTVATHVGVFIYRPSPDGADFIDCSTALVLHGVDVRPGAMPLSPVSVFAHGNPDDAPDGLQIAPIEKVDTAGLPIGTMDAFCSNPRPRVIARRRGGRVSLLVEPAPNASSRFDVALGAAFRRLPHPAIHEPRMQTCFLHTDSPARRLTLAVHLHRSLAASSVAMAGAYVRDRVATRIPGPEGRVHVLTPDELWTVRLPDPPRLEYLGLGLDLVEAPGYARQRELTQRLFQIEGWDPEEFVGFRIHVEYPVWNAQYLINLEFVDASAETSG